MKIEHFLKSAADSGVYISLVDGKLKCRAEKDALTAELREEIKERRDDLLSYFSLMKNRRVGRIPRRPQDEPVKASYAQRRLWFIDRLEGATPHYNIPSALILNGDLSLESFSKALLDVLQRHEVLRTNFYEQDGDVFQQVQDVSEAPVWEVDLSHLESEERETRLRQLAAEDARRPFDLKNDLMLRAGVVRLTQQQFGILLNMHHIASDGWSQSILINEFCEFYASHLEGRPSRLSELPIQYADFAHWQREQLSGDLLTAELDYWRESLQGIPQVHSLPLDKPRPAQQTTHGDIYHQRLDSALSARISAACSRHDVTLFIFLQTVFSILIGRYSNETDIVTGTPIAGREHSSLEPLIGFFVNTLVLRNRFSLTQTFSEVLECNKTNILEAYAHQQTPFELLVETLQPERSLSHSPLFQILFAVQNNQSAQSGLTGLELQPLGTRNSVIKFDLELFAAETQQGLSLNWSWNTDLFQRETIEAMAESFQQLLMEVIRQPDQALHQLPLQSPAQRDALLQQSINLDTCGQADHCIHQLVEDCAQRFGDADAVSFNGQTFSYEALMSRSSALAAHLRTQGVKADDLVGIYMDRSADMLVALLAVLKAGGAYLPLDPSYPPARLAYMLQDSQAALVITDHTHREDELVQGSVTLCIDDEDIQKQLTSRGLTDWSAEINDPSKLAYVIYTSGSTGQPKGVMLEHRSVVNFLTAMARFPFIGEGDVLAAVTPISFDIAVLELFLPLISGAKVLICPREVAADGNALAGYILEHAVTAMQATPATWQMLTESPRFEQLPSLTALCGGDRLSHRLAQDLVAGGHSLWNMYGPTETTVWSSCAPISQAQDRISIGGPIQATSLLVLDEHGGLLPRGAAGELHIGGDGLARGYLQRPELTNERFIPNPFDDVPGARLYKTGDLARWTVNGDLEMIGRIDHQIKVRGFRIELGEIEHQLSNHPGVSEAVVCVNKADGADAQLNAYLCLEHSATAGNSGQLQAAGIESWSKAWDESYRNANGRDSSDFDISGWRCSYRDGLIPAREMQEWVKLTCDNILSFRPRRVLEVGCGTGLLLHRYAEHCDHVVAIDPSQYAIDTIGAELKQRDWHHVQLRVADASDLQDYFDQDFDLIVMNSVVQYFPDRSYFEQTIAAALKCLAPGGRIYLGDVRNLDLLEPFHLSRAIFKAQDDVSSEDLIAAYQTLMRSERELAISPGYFHSLSGELADLAGVDLMVKRGLAMNEMMRYRYDVVLYKGSEQTRDVASIESWHQWSDEDALVDLLADGVHTCFGVYGMPNRRLAADIDAYQILQTDGSTAVFDADLQRQIRIPECNGIVHIRELAERHGYQCWATWSAEHPGKLDVLFSSDGAPEIRSYQTLPTDKLFNQPELEQITRQIIPEIKQALADQLPAYMLPNTYMVLESMPLTSNGKIDRLALPVPTLNQRSYQAPTSDVQKQLQHIWQELLNLSPISTDSNFFELGGHSLLATRMLSQVRKVIGVELPMKKVFEQPTIEGLATYIDEHDHTEWVLPEIEPGDPLEPAELSFAQQRLWFIHQLQGGSPQYNMCGAYRLHGPFDQSAFESAFEHMLERHESLRTCFVEQDGQTLQQVQQEYKLPLTVIDLEQHSPEIIDSLIIEHVQREATTSFDLERDVLLRINLFKVSTDEQIILLNVHHIATDGWSMGILIREFCVAYMQLINGRSVELPLQKIQYRDYARWQRRWLSGPQLSDQMDYWRHQLADLPQVHRLPLDYQRPAQQSFAARRIRQTIAQPLSDKITALCRRHEVTLFMFLQTALSVLISRFSGEKDVVLGTPVAGRSQEATESLIGLFVNTLVLRSQIDPEAGFPELLAASRQMVLDAFTHQHVPYEMLVEELSPERTLAYNPLCQIKLVLQNYDAGGVELSDLRLEPYPGGVPQVRFDLDITVTELENGLNVDWLYKTDLFQAQSIERLMTGFQQLIESVVQDDSVAVAGLSIIDDEDREKLLEAWQGQADHSRRDRPLHALFEDSVQSQPGSPAIECDSLMVSYDELNRQANQLAHYLLEQDVQPGDLVGLYVERSPVLMVGLLGILKAGATYVPLDPGYSRERLTQIVSQTEMEWMLSQSSLLDDLPLSGIDVLMLDEALAEDGGLSAYEDDNPDVTVDLQQSAYVIFTSGSTGQPKGVAVSHAGLIDYCAFADGHYYQSGLAGSLLVTSHSFDISIPSLYLPLLNGGVVTLLPPDRLIETLAEALSNPAGAGYLVRMTPSHVQMLLGVLDSAEVADCGHVFVIGGEAFSQAVAADLQSQFPASVIYNHYGPTETVVGCSIHHFDPNHSYTGEYVPIGRPMSNTRCLVLDEQQQPVPIGVDGELYIGGDCVAIGYINQPKLTQEKFVELDLPELTGRYYRTGDLVRWLPEGELVFLGRSDNQIKLRGFRIEPGEIESVLSSLAEIRQAAVLLAGDEAAVRLVAYIVPADPVGEADQDDRQRLIELCKDTLRQKLPAYMMPEAWVVLDQLPLSLNGKIDRRALPEPEQGDAERSDYRAPTSEVEAQLCAIWSEILNVEKVGIDDNFFELGGHSLAVIELYSKMKARQWEASVKDLYTCQTVAELASFLEQSQPAGKSTPDDQSLIAMNQSDAALNLFCLPPGGGMVTSYSALAKGLESIGCFYGLQIPESFMEKETFSMDTMASYFLQVIQSVQPHGPYILMGWSMGGRLAYEIACRIKASGEPVGYLGLFDALPIIEGEEIGDVEWYTKIRDLLSSESLEIEWDEVDQMTEREGIGYLADLVNENGIKPAGVSGDMVYRYFRLLANLHKAKHAYYSTPSDLNIDLFRPRVIDKHIVDEDDPLRLDLCDQWKRVASGQLNILPVDGLHSTMIKPPHVRSVLQKLIPRIQAFADSNKQPPLTDQGDKQ